MITLFMDLSLDFYRIAAVVMLCGWIGTLMEAVYISAQNGYGITATPKYTDREALLEPARLALVPPGDVHDAPALLLAGVLQVAADAALEEAPAPVAAGHSVVATGRLVAAHSAQHLGLVRRHAHGPGREKRLIIIQVLTLSSYISLACTKQAATLSSNIS
ncbi:hypothetical protein AVEN_101583-1 [Araneus ventricosus]|uniref:Uncharacterized protein n=1 Tax=Araneus ventricosus TaxID=182803 RepID=A0A4Y2VZZ6_ARAVE|nr:hypothetical protein AVEN_101583-1 [Araneus ventricosus]